VPLTQWQARTTQYSMPQRATTHRIVQELREKGLVFPCFCTNDELAEQKRRAEELKLPPIYRGKWASASAEDVQAELDKGTPHCYRFRVLPNKDVVVRDMVRGDVKFNTNTLGDFVVMRSNGLPVYNFCVAVDDALMEVRGAGALALVYAWSFLPSAMRLLDLRRCVQGATQWQSRTRP
jgi:glutamyl-tRNA synthetase